MGAVTMQREYDLCIVNCQHLKIVDTEMSPVISVLKYRIANPNTLQKDPEWEFVFSVVYELSDYYFCHFDTTQARNLCWIWIHPSFRLLAPRHWIKWIAWGQPPALPYYHGDRVICFKGSLCLLPLVWPFTGQILHPSSLAAIISLVSKCTWNHSIHPLSVSPCTQMVVILRILIG